MQQQDKRQNEAATKKAVPQNIAAKNEELTKQKTEPLENEGRPKDRREGDMENGELGADIKKDTE